MKYPEILAPAGSREQLEAAVRSGADAVYLGASAMNARRSAANFSDDELREAVGFCHVRGVKVYLTMNTLIFDSEIAEADRLLGLICGLGADGVIVQDIGLADRIARAAPTLPLHASTQTSVHTPSGLRMLKRLGFRRAVLARELSAEELRELCAAANAPGAQPMELEYFVHGALCMSVSGQCYMSAMLGQRSGNRGRCAQPCRLPFRDGGFESCLSLKDNCLIPHLDELADMGVHSLKIEGRMKRPEYCAAVTDACVRERERKGAADTARLAAVFSRSGFTDGYFTGERGRAMFGIRTKEDVAAADNATLASIHELYKGERRSVPVALTLTGTREGYTLAAADDDGHTALSSVYCEAAGDGCTVLGESTLRKLQKTGGTPYITRSLDADADSIRNAPPITPSMAGELRRQALEKLTAMRSAPVAKQLSLDGLGSTFVPHRKRTDSRLDMVFRCAEQLPDTFPAAGILPYGRAYLPLELPAERYRAAAERLTAEGIEPCVECFRGMFGREDAVRRMLAEKKALGARACMVHNLGAIEPVADAGMECVGGFGLNVTNTLSLDLLERLGLSQAELSFELTLRQIASLGGELERAVTIYGYLPLMLTRNCPAALDKGCKGLSRVADGSGRCFVTDRLGKEFPVMCREGTSEVFNIIPVCIVDNLVEIVETERFIARFTVENSVETENVLRNLMRGATIGNKVGVTRGLYMRGVQ